MYEGCFARSLFRLTSARMLNCVCLFAARIEKIEIPLLVSILSHAFFYVMFRLSCTFSETILAPATFCLNEPFGLSQYSWKAGRVRFFAFCFYLLFVIEAESNIVAKEEVICPVNAFIQCENKICDFGLL